MDHIRAALSTAIASGISLEEVAEMANHADTPEDFGKAVNILSTSIPHGMGSVWTPQGWVNIA